MRGNWDMAHNLSRHEPKKYAIFFFIIVGSAMPVQLVGR